MVKPFLPALLLLIVAVDAHAQQAPTYQIMHGPRQGSALWGLAEGQVVGDTGRRDLLVGGSPGSVFVVADGGPTTPRDMTIPTDLELAVGAGHKSLLAAWFRTSRGSGPAQVVGGGTDRVVIAGPVSASGTPTMTYRAGSSTTLGWALAATDVNSDGFDDLLIGDPAASKVYLVAGGSAVTGRDFASTPADVTITGPSIGGVLQTGDVTGDGLADLLIGAPFDGVGTVYLIRGGRGLAENMSLPADADAIFTGIQPDHLAGRAIEAADLDGDGFGDLIIGANGANSVYVIWGHAGISSRSLAAADVLFGGVAFGFSVFGGDFGLGLDTGDANRDGTVDLLVRSQHSAAIYYGRPRRFIPAQVTAMDRVIGCCVYRRPERSFLQDAIIFDRGGEGKDIVLSGPANENLTFQTQAGNIFFVANPKHGTLYTDTAAITRTLAAGQSAAITVTLPNSSSTAVNWSLILERNEAGSWISVSPLTGSSVAGSSGSFTVDLATEVGMAYGVYRASITVIPAGQPEQHRIVIPVAVTLTTPPPPPPSAKTDFSGDGNMDLLLRNAINGDLQVWAMSGVNRTAVLPLNPSSVPEPGWKIVGTGDFNADNEPDIVWQEETRGDIGVWLMNGTTRIRFESFAPVSQVDPGWKIVGVADLNNDGKPDLLWREETQGWLAVWLMNGTTRVEALSLNPGTVETTWEIVGNGDFNGDGKTDILWREKNVGFIAVWLMDGVNRTHAVALEPYQVDDMHWKIVATGDLNGDGKTDLVWQHDTQGWLYAWLMNGLTRASALALSPYITDSPSWKIVGPK